MPLLFYFPLSLFYFPFIVWMGMVKVVQDEMCVPQPAHDPISPK